VAFDDVQVQFLNDFVGVCIMMHVAVVNFVWSQRTSTFDSVL